MKTYKIPKPSTLIKGAFQRGGCHCATGWLCHHIDPEEIHFSRFYLSAKKGIETSRLIVSNDALETPEERIANLREFIEQEPALELGEGWGV